jgi:hypothetical protein
LRRCRLYASDDVPSRWRSLQMPDEADEEPPAGVSKVDELGATEPLDVSTSAVDGTISVQSM